MSVCMHWRKGSSQKNSITFLNSSHVVCLTNFLVAKLLYNYLRRPSVRPPDLGGNVIFSAPI